jgi:type VI secretion system secreted protein VgrG
VSIKQDGKPMTVTSPLGPDVLAIERLEVREAVSKQFEIDLHLLSTEGSIDPKRLLRQPMTVKVAFGGDKVRYFNGLVRRFSQLGHNQGFVSYRAELVPSSWFLSLTTDCRVYQQHSVPDIVKSIAADMGFEVKVATTGTYEPREYCVQYRETYLDFISRLMEEEGIFYFFEHGDGKHALVLGDSPTAVKAGAISKLKVNPTGVVELEEQFITELRIESEVVPGKVTLFDYNETTTKRVESTLGNPSGASAKLLQFDYPGKFALKGAGDRLARLRLEEAEALGRVISGTTNCPGVGSGLKLDIAEFYRKDVNGSYHVLSATHSAEEGSYRSGSPTPFMYVAAFEAIPYGVPYHPPRVTPPAVVQGTQTAVVVGPPGEEIYADKFGRVKVQFFWDRLGAKNDKSSCWVRVASTWAGKQWGVIHLPRIGQEVVVDFLEGDPDRPIVVGSVYNSEQMPPYALPDNMTHSGLKTRSAKQGSTEHFNEFRFEDKKDAEMIFLHAQKDLTIEVENDEIHTITRDRTKQIDRDETVTVKGKRTKVVEKDETVTVKGNQSVTIKEGNSSFKVTMGKLDTSVDQGNVTLKAGMGSIKYEAMQAIEIKVGSSSIKVDQSGITIKGLKVTVQGETMTEVKAPMTTIKADGILTMKGSMTMIN